MTLLGSQLAAFQAVLADFAAIARLNNATPRHYPGLQDLDDLTRTGTLGAFPQHTLLAGGVTDRDAVIAGLAAGEPLRQVCHAHQGAPVAGLRFSVCYGAYSEYQGKTLAEDPVMLHAAGPCWRNEEEVIPLIRQREFTMAEIIAIGSETAVRERISAVGIDVVALAKDQGLRVRVVAASDPFFGPTGRARRLWQQGAGLKQELVVSVNDMDVAIGSLNLHQEAFGTAFDIRTMDGDTAWTGCAAIGIERWVAARSHNSESDRAR